MLLFVAFGFSIFVNLLMLTGPLYMLQVYDRVLGSRSEETLVALSLLVGFLYGLMALLEFARGRIVARYAAQFQSKLDGLVFDASINAPSKPGEPPTSGLRDLETIQTTVASPVFLAFMDIPWSPIFIAGIFIFHPWLGWLAVAGGVLLLTITLLNQLLTYKKVQRAHGVSQGAQNMADQAHLASEVVRSQGMRAAVRRHDPGPGPGRRVGLDRCGARPRRPGVARARSVGGLHRVRPVTRRSRGPGLADRTVRAWSAPGEGLREGLEAQDAERCAIGVRPAAEGRRLVQRVDGDVDPAVRADGETVGPREPGALVQGPVGAGRLGHTDGEVPHGRDVHVAGAVHGRAVGQRFVAVARNA